MASADERVDLHTHSTASDGTFTPAALVEAAKAEGLAAIALTDHDTTGGLAEATVAGKRLGVEVVPAIEISAMRERGTLHIVGLFIDATNATLAEKCSQMQAKRAERNDRMLERLNALNMPITLEEVQAASGGDILGRPHVATVLLEKGYVANRQEAFDLWLAKGKPAYFPKALFDPAESIAMIHEAGGVAVIAHPDQLKCADDVELDATVKALKDAGMDGIETQWSNGTPEYMAKSRAMAATHDLLESGGSDFHGAMKPEIRLGAGLGQLRMTGAMLEALREAAHARR